MPWTNAAVVQAGKVKQQTRRASVESKRMLMRLSILETIQTIGGGNQSEKQRT